MDGFTDYRPGKEHELENSQRNEGEIVLVNSMFNVGTPAKQTML
jgi:hypothetical protein